MKADLHNQVALVTGAGRGIGFAIAQLLAENGARVVVADVDESAIQAATAELPSSIPLKLDVSSESEVNSGIGEVISRLGRIDILVNNAGINAANRVTVDQFSIQEWDRVMAVDLRGVFLVSRAVAIAMRRQQKGRIVNIASVAGLVPLRLQCAYIAAKAGVINLTRAMAIELASQGISVNGVAPGSTLTAMTEKVFYGEGATMSKQAQQLIDHIPAGRPASVKEVAQAVLFFVDAETSYITGQILSVDGGWTAGGFMRDF